MAKVFPAILPLFIILEFSHLAEACFGFYANSVTNFHPRQDLPDLCTTGKRQAPIDIDTTRCEDGEFKSDLKWFFHSGPLMMVNTGARVDVTYTRTDVRPYVTGGPLCDNYIHLNTHFHWGETDAKGSDHSIDGVFGPFEMHFNYIKKEYGTLDEARRHKDGLAIVAVMFELSSTDNADLEGILEGVGNVQGAPGDTFMLQDGALDFALKKGFSEQCFYNYHGSLTSNQCPEVVNWIVMKKPLTISSAQVAEFRNLVGSDGKPILSFRREIQPTNGRQILCSGCLCGR
ncbi:carbonic anhydrase 1-like [Neocloeon triangulifer]|uniref:carbonic anhydrase 1-like n=1 Tax=Neocloeon triangulifer TaxID=2078957 RepID=UPI00286F9B84|nr:carbonic anhydrase 1-like [Neocloeon triangulifer]